MSAHQQNIETFRTYNIGDKFVITDAYEGSHPLLAVLRNFEYNCDRELILVLDIIGSWVPRKIHPQNNRVLLQKI